MLIILFLCLLIVGIALNVLVLHLTTKFFKIEGLDFKKNLIITAIYLITAFIISFVIGIILAIAGLGYLTSPLTLLIGFAVFHKLFLKYYNTGLKKNLSIYIAYTVIAVIVSVSIIIPVRSYVIEPFYAKGDTMSPTYQDGDYLIINRINKNYKRGDVIVFRYPLDPQQFFIKRIIGMPGEKIQIKGESVIIYDSNNPDGKILNESYLESDIKTYGVNEDILELSNSEYYVLGDNRGASKDSRVFGAVDKSLIRGTVWFKGN